MSVVTMPNVAPPVDCLIQNLAALAVVQPRTHQQLAGAGPPFAVRQSAASDNTVSYCWNDERGKTVWLGRTTMPAIRAEALLESFQPGMGNVLLNGFGQGLEVKGLLARLLPHQAIFVLEPDAWVSRLVLSLHDFSEDFRAGRLLLFVGPRMFDDLRCFFQHAPGYLCPERVLSWPWFDERAAQELSRSLTLLTRDVESLRTGDPTATSVPSSVQPAAKVVAVVSAVASSRVRDLAGKIGEAVVRCKLTCERFALESPQCVHPLIVERRLHRFAPKAILLLDTPPSRAPCRLPTAPRFLIPTHGEPLDPTFIQELGKDTVLAARTTVQAHAAVKGGLVRAHWIPFPDAASPLIENQNSAPATNDILLVRDVAPCTAESVGLVLTSHQHLWRAAEKIMEHRKDTLQESAAEKLLDDAARTLKIELRSDSVRHGLIERMRQSLIPARRQERFIASLSNAGIAFRQFNCHGASTTADTMNVSELERAFGLAGLVIFLSGGSMPPQCLLDAAGLGRPIITWQSAWLTDADEGFRLLGAPVHIEAFSTDGELLTLIKSFQEDPVPWQQRAYRTRQHVLTHHTWARRMDTLLRHLDALPS